MITTLPKVGQTVIPSTRYVRGPDGGLWAPVLHVTDTMEAAHAIRKTLEFQLPITVQKGDLKTYRVFPNGRVYHRISRSDLSWPNLLSWDDPNA